MSTVKGDFSFVTADDLRPHLGANLRPYANDFVEAGREYGLDPRFLASISKLETANGTSPAFRRGNNAMGISNSRGPLYNFSSPRESIFRQAKSLARPDGYYKNARTIEDIGRIYAPPGAGNDPKGTNSYWPRGVSKFYRAMGGPGSNNQGNQGAPAEPLRARRSQPTDTFERTGALPNQPGTVLEDVPPGAVPMRDRVNMGRLQPEAPAEPAGESPGESAEPLRPPVVPWPKIRESDQYRNASTKERRQALEKWQGAMSPYLEGQPEEVRRKFQRKLEVENYRIEVEDPEATVFDAFKRGVLNTEAAAHVARADKARQSLESARDRIAPNIKMKLRPGEGIFDGAAKALELPDGKKARILMGTTEQGVYAVPPGTKGAMSWEEYRTKWETDIHQQAEQFKESMGKAMEAGAIAESLPQSRGVRAFLEAEGGKASLTELKDNFFGIVAHTVAESLPSIVAPVAGSTAAGPGGAAIGSFSVEYAHSLRDFLDEEAQKKGIDITTEDGLAAAMNDPAIWETAERRAALRAGPIAGIDAASMGLAGLLAKKLAGKTALKIATRGVTQAAVDAPAGAGGELAAQAASGQPIDPKAAALEAIGQVGTGAAGTLAETVTAERGGRTRPQGLEPGTYQDGAPTDAEARVNLDPQPIPDTADGAPGLGETMTPGEAQAREQGIPPADEFIRSVEDRQGEALAQSDGPTEAQQPAGQAEPRPMQPQSEPGATTQSVQESQVADQTTKAQVPAQDLVNAEQELVAVEQARERIMQRLEDAAIAGEIVANGKETLPVTLEGREMMELIAQEQAQLYERESAAREVFTKANALASGPAAPDVQPPGAQSGAEANLFTPTRERRAQQIDADVKAGKPVSQGDIRRYLVDKLDIPLRFGIRQSGRLGRALGIYKTRPEMLRTQKANDIETLAHEIGHHLHYVTLGEGRTMDARGRPTATDFDSRFDAEILPLGEASGTYQSAGATTRNPSLARREGVAEFVRHWLNEPAKARQEAPSFSAYFEGKLQKDHPQIFRSLERAQQMIERYHAQPAEVKLEAQIAFDDKGAGLRRSAIEWVRDTYRTWFDSLAPLTRMSNELVRLGVPESMAKAFDRRAHNYTSGWASKAQGDLIFEQRDLTGERVKGASLRRILRGMDADTRKEFSKYLVAKRAEELRARGIEPGVPKQSRDSMQRWEKRFEARRKELAKFQDNALQLLVDSGVLGKEDARKMRDANKDYVPFYRLMERWGSSQSVAGSFGVQGEGFVNLDSGVRKIKGSDREIVDPLESVVRNVMMFRQIAERNLVAREFVDAVGQARGGGKIADQIAARKRAVQVRDEDVVKTLIENGIIDSKDDIPADVRSLAFTFWEQMDQPKASDGEVVVRRGGKRENWQIMDQDVYRALTLADSSDIRVFKRVMPLAKFFTGATALLRTGATLTPEFIIRNPIRDQLIAGVNSRNGFIPFWDGFRGAISVMTRDKTYRDWVAAGGSFSGPISAHRQNLQEYLTRHIQDRSAREQALYLANVPARLLEALQMVSETTEAATRVSEFRKARNRGKGMTEAAMDAKDVTLDFSRSGPAGKAMNLMVAFLNAGLQDMDKIRREIATRPGNFVTKNLLYITVPTLALAMLNKDDDEIQKLPDWRQLFFWNINLGKLLGREDWILSLPKPFLLGAVFGTLPERAIDWAGGRDPNGLKKAGQAIWQNTLFRGDMMASISLFRPMLENMMNYSLFTGGPVVPERMQDVDPRYQFDPGRTSEFARIVGGQLNVSPMKIDNVVRGHFAGLGRHTTDFIDFVMQQMYHEEIPDRPTKSWDQWPGVRAFSQNPFTPSVYLDRFYKAMDRAEGRLATFKQMNALMTPEEAEKWWKKNGAAAQYYGALLEPRDDRKVITQLRRVQKSISEINKAMRQVYADKEMDGDQKRAALLQLNAQRDALAEQAFKKWIFQEDKDAVY